jgi:c-di-GMP-binding flagellar brake protein YcgR
MNSLMQQERRLYPRYSVDMTLDVDIDGNAEEPAFVARACNLSQNGISIICSDPEKVFVVEGLSYSDECVLHFALTEDEEVEAYKARLSVKRRISSTKYELGFHFLNIALEQEQKLEQRLYFLRVNR